MERDPESSLKLDCRAKLFCRVHRRACECATAYSQCSFRGGAPTESPFAQGSCSVPPSKGTLVRKDLSARRRPSQWATETHANSCRNLSASEEGTVRPRNPQDGRARRERRPVEVQRKGEKRWRLSKSHLRPPPQANLCLGPSLGGHLGKSKTKPNQ